MTGFHTHSIVELCALAGVLFWLVGLPMIWMGVRKARREFRVKGYLRAPSGTGMLRFLLEEEYEAFESLGVRRYFSIARFCLLGGVVGIAAAGVLVGCVYLLRLVSESP